MKRFLFAMLMTFIMVAFIVPANAERAYFGVYDVYITHNLKFKAGTTETDGSDYILRAFGSTVPTAAATGYAPGAIFTINDAALGMCPTWVNYGSATSCAFYPAGPVIGYGFEAAAGPIDCTSGNAATVITDTRFHQSAIPFAGWSVSDDTDSILSVAQTAGKQTFTITATADGAIAHDYVWAAIRSGCLPDWDIVAAGTTAAIAGDTTTIPRTISGLLVGDIAFVNYTVSDDSDTIVMAAVTANTLTITASADPVTGHTFAYVVLRPRGGFAPSHYIAYAGTHTTVGGAAAEAITIAGVAATDIPIVVYHTTNDTDTLVKAICTTNTLTVTCSADPSTAHKISYMVLRAY